MKSSFKENVLPVSLRVSYLETDVVIVFRQEESLLHHTLVLTLRKCARGVNDHTAGTWSQDARPAGETEMVFNWTLCCSSTTERTGLTSAAPTAAEAAAVSRQSGSYWICCCHFQWGNVCLWCRGRQRGPVLVDQKNVLERKMIPKETVI